MAASRRTLVILYALHSWAGIVTGLLLFVVCFSGSVMVFKNEIDLWANPSLKNLPHVAHPAGPDAVLASLHARYPDLKAEGMLPPDDVNSAWFVFAKPSDSQLRVKIAARPDNGEVIGPVDSELGQFFRMLHVFLFFGPRWIVGFLGVAMFFLIVSGFVIHRKIIKELFTVRWRKSFRLTTSDLHKSVGIWALGFHLMIAFTGAWLGLTPVFERAYAYVIGNTKTEVMQKTRVKTAVQVPSQSIDRLLVNAAQDLPDLRVKRIALRPAEQGSAVSFYGPLDGLLFSNAHVTYQAGKLKEKNDPRLSGFWSQFNGLMEPLHFGDYGGLVLKWLYFLIGLSPALLSLSGTLLWIERRKLKQRQRGNARNVIQGKQKHV
ncbi:MAG TPA: PepSY-associated TM helix domain-containing protein [Oxalicibacterium sp.]|uniref:PepSY-associated TM helix domain-containing protein n=1 Tax=Oxalicibacterium sp. TaxID=2766525 RepID=UPI002CFB1D9B|nr:PepSY-associated TM helix domain-containing protein [Oxalicibacterium sp.]HWU98730.1 PepSY-associated TM helix domain-containing protein [Oxalicibacterium sp.]